MLPEDCTPTHPGKILLDEFLLPMRVSPAVWAEHIGVPLQRINQIVRGKRGVTAQTAWLFSQTFGTTPQFWLNLQNSYDLARARPTRTLTRLHGAA